jgi:hypothetical protein
MTSINFPTSPALNEEYSFGDKTWIWNGYAWDIKAAPNTIIAVDDTSNTTLYPVMVGSAGNREVPKVTTSKFVFDATSGNLSVAGNIIVNGTTLTSGSFNYIDLQNKPAANIILTGDVSGSANALLTANSTVVSITTTVDPTLFDSSYLRLATATQQFVSGPVTFENNVTFTGNVTTISANNLIIEDNFIYLNSNDSNTNIDFGFVGNYNDGIYRHAGFFRDASDDGTWKVFDQYLPEPDAAVDIDTNDASFRLANFAANIVYTNRINVTSSAVVENLNADLLDGENGTYYTNYVNQTNKPAANIILTGDVSGSANALLTANSTVISVNVTIQPNSVTLGTDTTGAYVANLVQGSGITLTGLAGESATPTIAANVVSVGTFVGTVSNANLLSSILTVDGAGSGLDADLLDGENGTYYTNYVNQTNPPAANILLTGDISGSANATLTANSTIISVNVTIQPNSVELGTDTTGAYVANLVQGSGITLTGLASESATPTISANVVSVGTFVGAVSNANLLSSILTVDGAGSGLDADLLDGQEGSYYAADSTVVHIAGTETVTGLKTFANSLIITTDLTSDALRITQIGTGNALVVEDETNPDSTAFIIDNTGNTLIGTRVNTNNSKLVANGTISETVSGTQYLVVSQYDIGTDPNEIPLNQYLGTMAYQDYRSVYIGNLTVAGNITAEGNIVWTAGNDGANSGLDADLLDGNDSTYYTNYVNQTNPPAANIILTGDVAGSANATLTANSTVISINVTIQPNSVELGTDTTGDYVANLVQGSGVTITSGTGESSTPTIAANVVSVGTFVGAVSNANILSSILTVDGAGSGLDADLLDGQEGSYYANDAAVVHIAGTETVTGLKTFSNSVVISTNLTSDALRITQTGTGNALVVEDSTNPDSTPFVINGSGTIIRGYPTPITNIYDPQTTIGRTIGVQIVGVTAVDSGIASISYSSVEGNAPFYGSAYYLGRSKSGTRGTNAIVANGDILGSIVFSGDDGSNFVGAAQIRSSVDGTPGTNDMPGRLSFFTTASGASTSTERVRINSSGNVGIGTGSPTALLHVNGNTLITTNSSTDALRITQLGTGNAFVVEDSTNPDSTPFVINNSGRVGIGTRSPAYVLDVVGTSNIHASISGVGGATTSQQLFGSWTSANGDIDSLLPGSNFGTIHQGANNGHHVFGIRENDTGDSFSIISGGGNYTADLTYDTLIAMFRADGRVGIGTSSPLANLHVNSDAIITANTATDALRITQLGTGNAFVVEDETSPDSTAFIIDNTGNTYIGTSVNTNNSKLVANGTISESVSGTQYLVASQYDIGTDPNEIPINGYLGTLAFQDSVSVLIGNLIVSGNVGVGTTTPTYTMQVVGSFSATSKSFTIDHPTKTNYKLQYGSLESPYHGVRLTGEGIINNNLCTIILPDYIHGLCKQEESQVQITNIKHDKVIWIEDIDVNNNQFTVACNGDLYKSYRFYWSFTAIRKDVPEIVVEEIK